MNTAPARVNTVQLKATFDAMVGEISRMTYASDLQPILARFYAPILACGLTGDETKGTLQACEREALKRIRY